MKKALHMMAALLLVAGLAGCACPWGGEACCAEGEACCAKKECPADCDKPCCKEMKAEGMAE